MTTKVEIVDKARELIGGDRSKTHGDTYLNHAKIADVWNGILKAADKNVQLTAHDVANLMEGLKIARRYLGSFNLDDYIDGVGYAAVAGEIASRQQELNEEWARAAIKEGNMEKVAAAVFNGWTNPNRDDSFMDD